MAAETGFKINGEIYELPTLESLDLDERYILYDYTKLVSEDFLPQDGETEDEHEARTAQLMRVPGWWPALEHIAYRRVHKKELSDNRIKELIREANSSLDAWAETLSTVAPEDEDDVDPPALTTEPDASPSPSSVDSAADSGRTSTNGSDGADDDQPSTTTDESPTSSAVLPISSVRSNPKISSGHSTSTRRSRG